MDEEKLLCTGFLELCKNFPKLLRIYSSNRLMKVECYEKLIKIRMKTKIKKGKRFVFFTYKFKMKNSKSLIVLQVSFTRCQTAALNLCSVWPALAKLLMACVINFIASKILVFSSSMSSVFCKN